VRFNINRLRKEEIIWLCKNKCRHNHFYIEHQNCFFEERPDYYLREKVGYLDIECTGLNASWDYIISYAIKFKDKILGRVLNPREVRNWKILDKNLMTEFSKDVEQFDRLVVYWGKDRRHDIPFLRTRCLKWGINFPLYREVYVTDCYDIAKNKLSLHRYRLENVADFFKIPAKQHRLDPEKWQKAKLGDKQSLRHIWLHNQEDVITLEGVYEKLKGFVKLSKTTI